MLAKALWWVAIAPFVVEAFTSIGSAHRTVHVSSTSVEHYGWGRAAVSSDKSGFESGPAAATTTVVAAAVRDSDLDQFRDLDAILTERAARFYARSSREREKCILVGMCML
jgi:hypothetical protein